MIRVFVTALARVLNAIIYRTWQPMFDGRRRPDRSWLRPLEASVASLPTLDFIRPEMARAAPLRRCGARVLPGALFFKVNLPPHG